jgi:hypothetical protein
MLVATTVSQDHSSSKEESREEEIGEEEPR